MIQIILVFKRTEKRMKTKKDRKGMKTKKDRKRRKGVIQKNKTTNNNKTTTTTIFKLNKLQMNPRIILFKFCLFV